MSNKHSSVQDERIANSIDEIGDVHAKFRDYIGPMAKIILIISVIWALFQMYVNTIGVMMVIESRAWYFGFLLIMIFLLIPARKNSRTQSKLPTIWDWICIVATIVSVGYLLLNYNTYILERGGQHIPLDYWMGGLGILVAFEASRRAAGNTLTIIALSFLLYTLFGQYLPGIFNHGGFSLNRIVDVMYWGVEGVFGVVIGVASTYVFLFVLFGAFMKKCGFIDFLNDISLVVAGRSYGGPAKVAVFSSGLMGTINGSGAANVVTTGTMTIPLMNKVGFKKSFAGGVEAVASTGGLIAPPVMGAAAFVMAEYLSIPYRDVMIAAIIPALLYYMMCFLSVHFEAKKLGIAGLPKEQIPNLWKVLKSGGHLAIPMLLMIILLIAGMTPIFVATIALISTVIVSWFKKETRMGFKEIIEAIEDGVKGSLVIGAACTIVGVIVGTVSLTGVGLTLGNNIVGLVGDNLLLIAIVTMLVSIVLGMGVPVTASYIITVTIAAPLLVDQGVPVLTAHMFAFFFAALSDITPPVAMAVLAAAGIARERFVAVAAQACRIGAIGFMLPFMFLYNPALLMKTDTVIESVLFLCFSMVSVIALSAAFANWFVVKPKVVERILLFGIGIFMIIPYANYYFYLVGTVILIIIFIRQKRLVHLEAVPNSDVNLG
ncbi:TRAP transporter permease [Bacillus sp. Marseille-P3661]|uniref:TRAP transporter permease n=1 Tax=Bacillus sp. Marseille-P3661 TaxID=1936234 RepID=UPI0021553D45|nr:TRAP transporter permease [Bacillus sp. Marseille-P3661]